MLAVFTKLRDARCFSGAQHVLCDGGYAKLFFVHSGGDTCSYVGAERIMIPWSKQQAANDALKQLDNAQIREQRVLIEHVNRATKTYVGGALERNRERFSNCSTS